MRWRRPLVLMIGGVLAAPPAFPQEVRPEVVRIVRQGLRADAPVQVSELERLLLTRVGDPVDEALIERSVRRVIATDLFATVEVDRLRGPGGIEIPDRAPKGGRGRA